MRLLTYILLFVLVASTLFIQSVVAQQVSPQVMSHAVKIAKTCPDHWEKTACTEAISNSNMDMVVNYATALEKAGHKASLEPLKEHCAAATAIPEENIPAYAFQSAYTECVNSIYDISQKTKVTPDQSHYQLLVGSVLCLNKAPECAGLEKQMQVYAQ